MWRTTEFMENEDSDLSISDEADYGDNLREDCLSLTVTSEKAKVNVLSQLEMLKGASEDFQTNNTIIPQKDHALCLPRVAATCISDDEIISDDEVRVNNVQSTKSITSGDKNYQKAGTSNTESEMDTETCTWSAANREAEARLRLNKNAGHFSSLPVSAKGKMSLKGVHGKPKPRFSFHTHSHKEDRSWDVNSVSKSRTFFKGGNTEESENQAVTAELAIKHDSNRQSMVELLCSVQDNDALPLRTLKQTKRNSAQRYLKKSISTLGNQNIFDDSERLDIDSSNDDDDDDEDIRNNLKLIIPESIGKTMVEKFQEALGSASRSGEGDLITHPNHPSIGLFGRLQHVMQKEIKRDAFFLNQLPMEGKCIHVKILSRCLEAKLTVCSCACIGDNEVQNMKEIGRTRTIIFHPKMCGDVELEVGNMIRIHPPWREVHVMGREDSTILSAYFSQI